MSGDPYVDDGSSISGVMPGAKLGKGKGGAELDRQSTKNVKKHAPSNITPQFKNYAKQSSARSPNTDWQGYIGFWVWSLFNYDESYAPFIENFLGFKPGWFAALFAPTHSAHNDQPSNIVDGSFEQNAPKQDAA